jgi:two-component system chemotaxis response regulator CheB
MKEGSITRFRCHTGHTHVAESVLFHKDKQLEETLWIALRILEERRNMLALLAGETRNAGSVKDMYQSKIEETEAHIERLRKLISTDAGSSVVLQQGANGEK